jgi:RNA recognition motif-containing protein
MNQFTVHSFRAMSTTTMEIKAKKEKPAKKAKVTKLLEAPATTTNTAISPPPSAKEPHSKTGMKKKRKSPDFSEENSILDNSSEEPPSKKRKASIEEIEVDISKPEPPSKKALRRLKKGKPLPPPKNGADTSPEPEEDKPKQLEAEKRSEHGIWIGNLPWSVTKADLRTFLTSKSDIADVTITRIYMPSPDDGKPANKIEESKPWKKQHNKGFAYVDFSVGEAVQQAVELSEQLLSGRRVLIKDSKSFEGRPQKTKEERRNDGKPPSRRVFLGNLRFDTTEDSLKEHFEKCGAIENIMVATFEDSGKCKGYAWITFEELEAAESAVRGYVLVKQEDEDTESDSEQVDNDEKSNSQEKAEEEEEDKEQKLAVKKKPKKPAMKKLFVDMIHKRPVRREFAEDAQVRYKKRYGKDGTKGKTRLSTTVETNDQEAKGPRDRDGKQAEKVRPLKQVEYRTSYAPRLTGGIVESEGKKVVF